MSMASDTDDDRLVPVKLGEIRRLRDALQRERDRSNIARQLWLQVAGLYQRLQQTPQRKPTETVA